MSDGMLIFYWPPAFFFLGILFLLLSLLFLFKAIGMLASLMMSSKSLSSAPQAIASSESLESGWSEKPPPYVFPPSYEDVIEKKVNCQSVCITISPIHGPISIAAENSKG